MNITIDEVALAASVQKILVAPSNHMLGNPLATIVADAITAAAPALRTRIDNVTREFVASDEFAKRIRQVYRDALLGEASRMGRNAARAAVNAKPDSEAQP